MDKMIIGITGGLTAIISFGLGTIFGTVSEKNQMLPNRMYIEDINQDGNLDFIVESVSGEDRYVFTQTGENEYSMLVPRKETKTIYELKK